MFRKSLIALASLSLLTLASVAIAQVATESAESETASDDSGPISGQGNDDPQWIARADALFLTRSAAGAQQLLFEPRTATELLDATNLGFSNNAGPRLSLCREDSSGSGLELTYFGIDGWTSQAAFPTSSLPFGVGYLSIDNTIRVPVNSAQFLYRSGLYSAELNDRYAWNDWLTAIAGFRWIDFEDRYDVSGIENAYSGPFSHSIHSHDHLYGAQVGLDFHPLDRARPFQIHVLTKTGIYGNAAAQSNDYADTVFSFSESASESHLSFLSEVGLMGSYQFTPHIALRGGYQVMWLTGVALAPDQIPATDFGAAQATVNTSGTLFCHGAFGGLEVTW
jgi:hypothetical protein